MTRRRTVTTDRLIMALGLVVVLLGAVLLWSAANGARPGFRQEPVAERVLRQAHEQLGPQAEVRLIEPGHGRIVCGYLARAPGAPSYGFVSRPNRLLLSDDPLGAEFHSLIASDCPGFPVPPGPQAVP